VEGDGAAPGGHGLGWGLGFLSFLFFFYGLGRGGRVVWVLWVTNTGNLEESRRKGNGMEVANY